MLKFQFVPLPGCRSTCANSQILIRRYSTFTGFLPPADNYHLGLANNPIAIFAYFC